MSDWTDPELVAWDQIYRRDYDERGDLDLASLEWLRGELATDYDFTPLRRVFEGEEGRGR